MTHEHKKKTRSGSEWEQEKTSKKGQRLWKKPTITEEKKEDEGENEERDYSFLFSFNMNTLYETRIPGNNVRHVYFQI